MNTKNTGKRHDRRQFVFNVSLFRESGNAEKNKPRQIKYVLIILINRLFLRKRGPIVSLNFSIVSRKNTDD